MRYLNILLFFLLSVYVSAQENTPRIKTLRTTVYQAVQKDTTWITGNVIDRVHFLKFDRNGRRRVENILNPDGSAHRKVLYLYNKEGRISEEVFYTGNEGLTRIYTYGYDAEGRLTEEIEMTPQREWKSANRVRYNKWGKIEQREQEDRDFEGARVFEIEYDAHNKPVNVRVQYPAKNGKIREISRNVEKWDTLGLKYRSAKINGMEIDPELFTATIGAEAVRVLKSKEKGQREFSYDAFGNWVKRIDYSDGQPKSIALRMIEYDLPESDWEKMPLSNRVKSVFQTSYVADPRGPETILRGKKQGQFFRRRFNDKGWKLSEELYSETGVLQGTVDYEYSPEGDLLKEIHKSAAGKKEKSILWNYADNGELRTKTWLDAADETVRKGVFRYDVEGNNNRESWFLKDGTMVSDVNYMHNSYGQRVGVKIILSADGNFPYKFKGYAYSFQGRITEELTEQADGTRTLHTYKYNTKGEVISGSEQINNEPEKRFVYKFFSDAKGNWLKRIKFVDDVPVIYEEREYIYYND